LTISTYRVGPIAPVVSGGVGWFPWSAADKPGLFSPLNVAAAAGAAVAGEAVGPGDATATLSFAVRRASAFMARKGFGCVEDF
jgi:hypothetical protein